MCFLVAGPDAQGDGVWLAEQLLVWMMRLLPNRHAADLAQLQPEPDGIFAPIGRRR